MKSSNRIFLIGLSGSGKSTLGAALAKKMKVPFLDTDQMITDKAKMSITRIFSERGETYFRELEHRAIRRITQDCHEKIVVALGGGAFQDPQNRRLVSGNGIVVYLSCSQRALLRRLRQTTDRPLLGPCGQNPISIPAHLRQTIRQLLARRQRNYKLADIRISTSNQSVIETVELLLRKIRRFNESH